MSEESRVQVRKDNTENSWADVGNKVGNEKLPVDIATSTGTFHVNNYEVVGNITYVGEENKNSDWRVTELNKATGVIHYASIFNNALVLTYVTAWADRALLVYGDYPTS